MPLIDIGLWVDMHLIVLASWEDLLLIGLVLRVDIHFDRSWIEGTHTFGKTRVDYMMIDLGGEGRIYEDNHWF